MHIRLSAAVMGLTAVAAVAAAEPVTYEAEKAVMTDLAVDTTVKGFSGESYVMAFTNEAGSLTFNVDAPAAGLYEMVLGYATPSGGKWCNLIVNELPEGEIELPGVEGFAETKPTLVLLQQGANKLTIEKGWGFYAIDFLKLSPAAELPPHQVTAELINPSASAPAKALMAFLVSNFGKNIIAGQQEYPQNPGREVKQLREPRLYGPYPVPSQKGDLVKSRRRSDRLARTRRDRRVLVALGLAAWPTPRTRARVEGIQHQRHQLRPRSRHGRPGIRGLQAARQRHRRDCRPPEATPRPQHPGPLAAAPRG
jgi:hypothetical protein